MKHSDCKWLYPCVNVNLQSSLWKKKGTVSVVACFGGLWCKMTNCVFQPLLSEIVRLNVILLSFSHPFRGELGPLSLFSVHPDCPGIANIDFHVSDDYAERIYATLWDRCHAQKLSQAAPFRPVWPCLGFWASPVSQALIQLRLPQQRVGRCGSWPMWIRSTLSAHCSFDEPMSRFHGWKCCGSRGEGYWTLLRVCVICHHLISSPSRPVGDQGDSPKMALHDSGHGLRKHFPGGRTCPAVLPFHAVPSKATFWIFCRPYVDYTCVWYIQFGFLKCPPHMSDRLRSGLTTAKPPVHWHPISPHHRRTTASH